MIAEILETGRRLTTIYVTHAHPDHYFGVGTIAGAFPQARVVATPEDADMINRITPPHAIAISPSMRCNLRCAGR